MGCTVALMSYLVNMSSDVMWPNREEPPSRLGSAVVHFILVPRAFPGRRSWGGLRSWQNFLWSCYAKRAARPRGIFNSSRRSAATTALPRCSRQLRRLILWKRFELIWQTLAKDDRLCFFISLFFCFCFLMWTFLYTTYNWLLYPSNVTNGLLPVLSSSKVIEINLTSTSYLGYAENLLVSYCHTRCTGTTYWSRCTRCTSEYKYSTIRFKCT